ncbi:MAG: DUF5011 domain-containing protein [Nitrosopumilus sp. H13]|nr:MAG: DUF5011 domain-containing protein [Nitrosopumilus sp. H13]
MISFPATALSIVIALAAAALLAPLAHADVLVDGSIYGKSVIIKLASESEDVRYFKVWLEDGIKFDSFKAESGWTGEKIPDGSVLFTASDELGPDKKARFGLVADKSLEKINWQVDGANDRIGSGVITVVTDVVADAEPEQKPEPVFRIIPERPNIGSTIRVVGESLQPSADFAFYISNERIGEFATGGNGYFAGTAKIPSHLSPGRTEFRLGNGDDAMTFSIILDHPRGASPSVAGLVLEKVPDTVHRAESITLQGKGEPNTRIIIKVTGPDGMLENSLISETDDAGMWSVDPIRIGFDSPFGSYTATVTDGRHTATGTWSIESDRVMDISPVKKILKPGDVIRFEGTALPNEQIHLAIENPDGNKVGTEIITTNDSGRVEYEYPTSKDSKLGSYTLIAIQGDQTEFAHTSLGKKPAFDFNLELDKITYIRGETIKIAISGDKSDTLNLAILSEKGATHRVEYDAQIRLDLEGRSLHHVYLSSNYTEGTYTARLSKGNVGDEEKFGVDLDRKSTVLVIGPVKDAYARGETMLIIGTTAPSVRIRDNPDPTHVCDITRKNIPIIIRLVDPDGKIIRSKPTFIDNNCSVIDMSFKIPDDAVLGTWKTVSNIKTASAYERTGSFVPPNNITSINAAARQSYEGCVPATDLGKLVLLACRKDVDGPNPTPVLKLVSKTGVIVWERETALVDDIFEILNEKRGVIQGLEAVAPSKTQLTFDHDCADPIKRQPRNSTSQSNQTKIDLLGIKHVSCSYGEVYNAPMPLCTGSLGIDPVPKHNASALDRFSPDRQIILFTCGAGTDSTDSAIRTITMIDSEKPRIFLDGRTVANHFRNDKYIEPGWRCIDNADKNPILLNNIGHLNIGKLGEHKITYTCTDASGNKAVKSRTITIVDPCDLDSYADARGNIPRNILGCGGTGITLVESSFDVVDIHGKNLKIITSDGGKVDTGDLVNVIVTGSKKGTVISITYEDGRQVHKYTIQNAGNEVVYHWLTDRLIEPGTYTISATYEDQKAEAEHHIQLR